MEQAQTDSTKAAGATHTAAAPKKSNKLKGLLIGAGIVAVGVGGYFFIWPLIKRNKDKLSSSASDANTNHYVPDTTTTSAPKPTAPKPAAPAKPKDAFPLKKGSNGPNVKALQNALIAKYGASILPKYGADGDFGSETEAALKSKGMAATVDETTFIQLTQVIEAAVASSAVTLSDGLLEAARTANFSKALSLLAQIKNTDQYSAVSNKFKEEEIVFYLPRYTLVTGMFRTFTTTDQTEKLRNAFTAMGLKWDKDKDVWSIPSKAAVSGFSLITTQITHVWPDPHTAIQVPASMVLGQEIERKGDFIAFENNGSSLLVPAAHVRYA